MDAENPSMNLENRYMDLDNPYMDLENPYMDLGKPVYMDPENLCTDLENLCMDLENLCMDLENPVHGPGKPYMDFGNLDLRSIWRGAPPPAPPLTPLARVILVRGRTEYRRSSSGALPAPVQRP